MKRQFLLVVSKENNPYANLSQSGFAALIGRLKGVSGSTSVDIGDDSVFALRFSHTVGLYVKRESVDYAFHEFVQTLSVFLGGAEVRSFIEITN